LGSYSHRFTPVSGIERDDASSAGGEVERSIHNDWRRFETNSAPGWTRNRLASVGDPSDGKLGHGVTVDVAERRKSCAAAIMAVDGPVLRRPGPTGSLRGIRATGGDQYNGGA